MRPLILIVIITTALIALVPLNLSLAKENIKNNKDFPHKGMFWEKLNLTKEQKDQIDKFRLDHQREVIDLRASIKKNRLDIEELLKNQNLDEGKIRSLVSKNSELQAKVKESALNMWLKAYKILDEKQKEMWREYTPFLNGERSGLMHNMGPGNGMGIRDKIIRKFRHNFGHTEKDIQDDDIPND